MANLSKTRTVFAFTSPRTIEKIIPEINILIENFAGENWDEQTQVGFFNKLYKSEFYEGSIRPNNLALAARDRITRAPKALGFIDLRPRISLTPVGEKLLNGKRLNEVICRQLLKFQLPSPYHQISQDRNYNVRPYLELIRAIKKLGTLSKVELAIFFVQITNHNKFDEIVNTINLFREALSLQKGNRKTFIDNLFTEEILKIYSNEIEENNIKTRESADITLKKFIRTKKSNHLDYADAFIRYLRATQLISFDKKTYRVIISPARIEEVEYILKSVNREAIVFSSETEFKNYLFNPYSLLLLTDQKEYIEKKLLKLNIKFNIQADIDELKDLLEISEIAIISKSIQTEELSLKDYKEYEDILDVFNKILNKEIPDPPLYLEWNIWRSFVMMNFVTHIQGNFRIDLDGVPLSTALGNMPDIEIEYEDFKLIVEVTMSSGNKQYEMENEPVARHFGKIQISSVKPVYCFFIAPKINDYALAHFFNLNRMHTKVYGGKTRILPMALNQFINFITIAKTKKFNNSKVLKIYLDKLIEQIPHVGDETIWLSQINDSISSWCN